MKAQQEHDKDDEAGGSNVVEGSGFCYCADIRSDPGLQGEVGDFEESALSVLTEGAGLCMQLG